MKPKHAYLGFIIVLLFSGFSLLPTVKTQEANGGNITFQPNVIPFTEIYERVGKNKTTNELNYTYGSGERFRFAWLNNTFDIEIFFNASGRLYSLRDFEDDFNVVVNYLTTKNESAVQFGWVIDNVENVSDYVHNAWFKIEDSSFDYEEIMLETIEAPEEPYNITRFHLPDNLVLSFEDLYHKGFVIGWQNKTSTSVKGFSNKTSWNLDPITFSSPTITVIGGTEGSPLDFKDIWDADQAGGWNVVHNNNGTNRQFEFNARIVLGNGTVAGTTYFTDTGKHVTFTTIPFTANWQIAITVSRYSYVTIGVLVDVDSKTTKEGCAFMSLTTYANYMFSTASEYNKHDRQLYVYSSSYHGEAGNSLLALARGGDMRFWNILLDSSAGLVINPFSGSPTINIFNIMGEKSAGFQIYGSTGLTVDKVTIAGSVNAIWTQQLATFTLTNVYVRQMTRLFYGSTNWQGPAYLVDFDSDNWDMLFAADATGEVYRQYSFGLTVTNVTNNPVENANVTITYEGQGGGTVGSWLTYANGSIPTQTLTQGFYNQTGGDTIYSYNPYNITITKTGYFSYTQLFTLNDKKEWQMALLIPQASVTYTSAILVASLFLLIPVLAVIFVWRWRS